MNESQTLRIVPGVGSLRPLLFPQVGQSRVVSPKLQTRKPRVRGGRDLLSGTQPVLQLEKELGTFAAQSCAISSVP